MNKHIKLILAFTSFSILLIIAAYINAASQNKSSIQGSTKNTFRYTPNEAFGYGEKLEYKVKFSFITAGEGYFYILPKPIYRNERECFDIRFQVKSLKSLEFLYKVRDNYRTALDISGIFPWEFEQNVREGKYSRDFKATFDQVSNFAYADNKKYKIPPYVHDAVSAFFYVRTMNINAMKKDSVFYLQNFWKDSTFKLGVKMLGRSTIETDAGKFRCIVIEPMVVEGGLFKNEGQILIYLTDDERRIPVKVSTKILIGYVSAELVQYSGLRGPLKAKIG